MEKLPAYFLMLGDDFSEWQLLKFREDILLFAYAPISE